MQLLAFVFIIILTNSTTSVPATISPAIMDQIISIIDKYYFNENAIFPIGRRKVLRLALHDCMGGCDGSLNINNTGNNGLFRAIDLLSRTYNNPKPGDPNGRSDNLLLKTYLTRADYIVLTTFRALSLSIKAAGNGNPIFNNATPVFQYGRTSNPNGPYSDDY